MKIAYSVGNLLLIYIVVISVYPIIAQNPWTDLHQILIGELGRTKGMFLAWF